MTAIGVILPIIVTLYALRQMKKIQGSIPKMGDFVEIRKNEKGEPEAFIEPRLALVLDGLMKRGAQSLFQSFKMSGLQGLGATAKLAKGLKGAMAKDVIEEKMPLLELAGEFLGFNTKQYIAKNPEAMLQLANIAAPFLSKIKLGNNGGLSRQSNNRAVM